MCRLFFVIYINLIIIVDPAFSGFFPFSFSFFWGGRFVIQVMCVLFLIFLCFALISFMSISFTFILINDEILELVG